MAGGREDSQSSIPITTTDEQGDGREDPLAPGAIIGSYRVLRLLGSGGMGSVLAARHVENGQPVALKVMHPEMAANADAVRRFMREGKAAALLVSQHSARIYDVGRLPSGVPFMAMEYLDGEDLEELAERRKLEINEVVDYVRQATAAISEAHANGLVHRDLKPQNLFLARSRDGTSSIKVLDFGLAKDLSRNEPAADSQLTTDNMLIGSPHFMSPEQVRSPGQVDGRTDIWALGATLYVLVAGDPPFVSPTMYGLLACIMTDPAPRLRERRPEAPEALEKIILRCLEKEPDARYATVDELAAALRMVALGGARERMPSLDEMVTEDTGTLVMTSAAGPSPGPMPGPSPGPMPGPSPAPMPGPMPGPPGPSPPHDSARQSLELAQQLHGPVPMPAPARPSFASFPAIASQFSPQGPLMHPPPGPAPEPPPTPVGARLVVAITMGIASAFVIAVLIAVAVWALGR